MSSRLLQIFHPLRAYWAESRGAAAAEFAIVLTVLLFPLLNIVDFGMYIYQGMELNEAAQAAAEAVLVSCTYANPPMLPATVNCGNNGGIAKNAATSAAQATSLGMGVTVAAPSENYYCVKADGSLLLMGPITQDPPADCGAAGFPANQPGDYILITTTFNYTPFFTGVSLASQLASPLTRTAWMRLS